MKKSPNNFFLVFLLHLTDITTVGRDCEFCSQTFKYKGDYTRHLRTHLGDELYACEEPGCTKRFRYSLDLERHKAEHYVAANNTVDKMETD